jgi:hypothetical protein
MSKKVYTTPKLSEQGSIKELTEAVVIAGSGDIAFLEIDPDNDILAGS